MISVVIAVYNEPELLEALCKCLVAQDYRGEWELLVCDDGSSVDMASCVRQTIAGTKINARYIWQPHCDFRAGLSRNNGIRLAAGDLLVFVDGDMLVRPDFLSTHAELHDGSLRIVCGTRRLVTAKVLNNLLSFLDETPDQLSGKGSHQRRVQSHMPWMTVEGHNFSVPNRPEVIFDERLMGWGSDDRDLAIRLTTRNGYDVLCSNRLEAIHVVHVSKHDANPFRTGKHEDIVGFMRNKIYLCDKYPDFELGPTLDLLLTCYLDPATDEWYMNRPTPDRTLASVIQTIRDWMQRHGVEPVPVTPADGDKRTRTAIKA